MDPLIDQILHVVTSDAAMSAVILLCLTLPVFAVFGAIEQACLRLSRRFPRLRIPKWFLPKELRS